MLCDWIATKIFDINQTFKTFTTQKIDNLGELVEEYPSCQYIQIKSSSPNIWVYSPNVMTLNYSANPTKQRQDHNLWGSSDVNKLTRFMTKKVVNILQPDSEWEDIETNTATRSQTHTRIDLTRNYRFNNSADLKRYMKGVVACSHSRVSSGNLYSNETAYFGQKSRRWTLKIYDKHAELKAQNKKKGIAIPKELVDWAEGVLRFELTLRAKELAMKPLPADTDDEEAMQKHFMGYYNKMIWSSTLGKRDMDLSKMKRNTKRAYLLWKSGVDLREEYKKAFWYSLRKEILDVTGQDIKMGYTPSADAEGEYLEPIKEDDEKWDPQPLRQESIPFEG